MREQRAGFSWGHININVSDLERAIEFYEKLGFTVFIPAIPYLGLQQAGAATMPDSCSEALAVPAGASARACIMQLGQGFPKLDLIEFDYPQQRSALNNSDLGIVRLCLACNDLQQQYESLREQGVRFLSPPQAGHDGLADVAVCVDPDGSLIELIQVYLHKWPAP